VAQAPAIGSSSNTRLSLLQARQRADATCAQQSSIATVQEQPASHVTTATQQTWNPNPLYWLGSYDPSAPADTQGLSTTTSPHLFGSSEHTSDAAGPASAAGSNCQHCGAHATAHLARALVAANASVTAAREQLLAAHADIALLLGEDRGSLTHTFFLRATICCQSVSQSSCSDPDTQCVLQVWSKTNGSSSRQQQAHSRSCACACSTNSRKQHHTPQHTVRPAQQV
jgi:hypothetical protein